MTNRTTRGRRVSVDREVEVVIASNTIHEFFYENPRMNMAIDLQKIGDEEYVTVGDLRVILNSNRAILENFDILIKEVLDDRYSLEDVLQFLGLSNKYAEYYKLSGRYPDESASIEDIKDFLLNTPVGEFEDGLKNMDSKLRSKIILASVTLFKLEEFSDFNKMRVIQDYVGKDVFDDAQVTEVNKDVYI